MTLNGTQFTNVSQVCYVYYSFNIFLCFAALAGPSENSDQAGERSVCSNLDKYFRSGARCGYAKYVKNRIYTARQLCYTLYYFRHGFFRADCALCLFLRGSAHIQAFSYEACSCCTSVVFPSRSQRAINGGYGRKTYKSTGESGCYLLYYVCASATLRPVVTTQLRERRFTAVVMLRGYRSQVSVANSCDQAGTSIVPRSCLFPPASNYVGSMSHESFKQSRPVGLFS